MSNHRYLLSEGQIQHEQQLFENNRLNLIVNCYEKLMVQFRKNYKLADAGQK